MISFLVEDMTCGHCVATIRKALDGAAPGAAVHIDLAAHRVEVDAPPAESARLAEAIAGAGYTPLPA